MHWVLGVSEKNTLVEEANKLIATIRQMNKSLEDDSDETRNHVQNQDNQETSGEFGDLKVTYPLLKCVEDLKEKHAMIQKVYQQRFEQVKSKSRV